LASTFISAYGQNDVSFNGISGYATIQFDIGNNPYYEVTALTAVPEPSTWIGGALALAAIGYTQRRRLKKRLRVIS